MIASSTINFLLFLIETETERGIGFFVRCSRSVYPLAKSARQGHACPVAEVEAITTARPPAAASRQACMKAVLSDQTPYILFFPVSTDSTGEIDHKTSTLEQLNTCGI
jgi:hypothetical protein